MTGAKEPLMHIVKRDGVSLGRAMLVRLVALVFALLVCAAIIFGLTGMNPLNVYAGIWDGAVGTNRRMWVTFRDAAILLCVGFAVLPLFACDSGMWARRDRCWWAPWLLLPL